MDQPQTATDERQPWNKGKLIGQKSPLKAQEVWEIRVRLTMADKVRDLELFNLALDSKLRGCDLVRLKVADVCRGTEPLSRAMIVQSKTSSPVQFELTEPTRKAIIVWVERKDLGPQDWLFPSRKKRGEHLTTRQYARLVQDWAAAIGLPRSAYATHSLRRTKATMLYRKTGNLRAIQLLLGHAKIDSTVRYLGVEVEGALALSEGLEL
ncbi:tyrosine-type recombinase/integrase [Parvularcula sp. ZS-1/3]|uniref:Tyrosine-type recombinase/integrase n=1 Tax=Parvularcula mediterranea TaxID=2732508 RepID=A0A7Y3RPN2_9PROT|nr:tyrosine-type recombinase/integrase [Parvularcula mediterranea]NNU17082.1 tyrosine-type recombinase/integrase [Parvularcula mediterranea]